MILNGRIEWPALRVKHLPAVTRIALSKHVTQVGVFTGQVLAKPSTFRPSASAAGTLTVNFVPLASPFRTTWTLVDIRLISALTTTPRRADPLGASLGSE